MVFAWSARSAKTRGAATTERFPKRVSKKLSRESCSETRSGTHAVAAAPRVVAERAPHANTEK
eukprot:6864219-Lingulodinium_polyedra.AAC.1